jgi:hypothetical protein
LQLLLQHWNENEQLPPWATHLPPDEPDDELELVEPDDELELVEPDVDDPPDDDDGQGSAMGRSPDSSGSGAPDVPEDEVVPEVPEDEVVPEVPEDEVVPEVPDDELLDGQPLPDDEDSVALSEEHAATESPRSAIEANVAVRCGVRSPSSSGTRLSRQGGSARARDVSGRGSAFAGRVNTKVPMR